jgi:hypothetical protein
MKALITIIIFVSILNSNTKHSIAQENRIISDQEVLDTAYANLNKFREKIGSMYKSFGFNTEEELNHIELGAPYEFVLLHPDFINDTVFTEDKNYFYNENKVWKVPVICDSSFRTFMTIFNYDDTLKYSSTGGNAMEFDTCERHYSIPKNGKRYNLWPEIIYQCDFIVLLDSTNNYRFYPLYFSSCLRHVSYNKHNSMKSFFDTYRTQVYTSVDDLFHSSLKFEIYPNPLFNSGNLRGYIPPNTKEANIKIYDITGKIIYKQNLTERGNIDIELNESLFSKNGVHICNIILDGNTISKKILVY